MTVRVSDPDTLRESVIEFDLVLAESATQAQIFEEVRPLATSVMDGYNICIFAYGQTGSGKTYTMEGPPHDRGVNFRVLEEVFTVANHRGADYATELSVSIMEIYNNVVFDLLGGRRQCKVRFSEDAGVVVEPLVKQGVGSTADVERLLVEAYRHRSVAGTDMNQHSSRSHCILTLYCRTSNTAARSTTAGKLHLIDLAGSERIKASGVEGDRLKESTHINTSLTHLKSVIQGLATRNAHVPYRNSALTSVLQDSLGGNCKCLMFANVSCLTKNAPETLCTMKYAAEARKVEVGKVTANVTKH